MVWEEVYEHCEEEVTKMEAKLHKIVEIEAKFGKKKSKWRLNSSKSPQGVPIAQKCRKEVQVDRVSPS